MGTTGEFCLSSLLCPDAALYFVWDFSSLPRLPSLALTPGFYGVLFVYLFIDFVFLFGQLKAFSNWNQCLCALNADLSLPDGRKRCCKSICVSLNTS